VPIDNGFLKRHYTRIYYLTACLIKFSENMSFLCFYSNERKMFLFVFAHFLVNSSVAADCITFVQATNLVVEFGEI